MKFEKGFVYTLHNPNKPGVKFVGEVVDSAVPIKGSNFVLKGFDEHRRRTQLSLKAAQSWELINVQKIL